MLIYNEMENIVYNFLKYDSDFKLNLNQDKPKPSLIDEFNEKFYKNFAYQSFNKNSFIIKKNPIQAAKRQILQLRKFPGGINGEDLDSKTTGLDLNFEDEKLPESFLKDYSSCTESLSFSESSLLDLETQKEKEKKEIIIPSKKIKVFKKDNFIGMREDTTKSTVLSTRKCKMYGYFENIKIFYFLSD
jgi:hypothetical protein